MEACLSLDEHEKQLTTYYSKLREAGSPFFLYLHIYRYEIGWIIAYGAVATALVVAAAVAAAVAVTVFLMAHQTGVPSASPQVKRVRHL